MKPENSLWQHPKAGRPNRFMLSPIADLKCRAESREPGLRDSRVLDLPLEVDPSRVRTGPSSAARAYPAADVFDPTDGETGFGIPMSSGSTPNLVCSLVALLPLAKVEFK